VNEGGPWPRHFNSSRPKAPNISSYSTMELFQKVFAPSKKCASKFDCLDELVIVTWTCSLIPLPVVLLSLQVEFLLGLLSQTHAAMPRNKPILPYIHVEFSVYTCHWLWTKCNFQTIVFLGNNFQTTAVRCGGS
jgi:hypothetical protein